MGAPDPEKTEPTAREVFAATAALEWVSYQTPNGSWIAYDGRQRDRHVYGATAGELLEQIWLAERGEKVGVVQPDLFEGEGSR